MAKRIYTVAHRLLISMLAALFVSCGGGTGPTVISVPPPAISAPRFAYVANLDDNTVSIYTVNASTGKLRAHGFVATGAGTMGITVHPSGKYAYVTNSGPNTISTYSIDANSGALTQIGTDVAGGGSYKVTIDPTGRFAYAPNYGTNDVSAYSIAPTTGLLTPVICGSTSGTPGCGSTVAANFAAGVNPVSIAIDPAGRFVYVANVDSINQGASYISAYTITSTGALKSAGVAASGVNPHFVAVDPTGKFVYAANETSDDVSAYKINPTTGALTQISCGTAGTAGCTGLGTTTNFTAGVYPFCIAFDLAGKFAFVGNSNSGTISTYSINASTGALSHIGQDVVTSYPESIIVDPTGKFAYTASSMGFASAFAIDANGGLTSLGTAASGSSMSIALVNGTAPVAYTPKFAYVANNNSNDISAYTIDPKSGGLTQVPCGTTVSTPCGTTIAANFAAGAYPSSISVDPSGKFAYVANTGDGVSAYTINASTGALKQVVCGSGCDATTPANFAAGLGPRSLIIDPSGKYAYVANMASGTVSAYTVNAITGVLNRIGSTDVAAGKSPISITITPSGKFAYVANWQTASAAAPYSYDVSAYRINPSTGALTQIVCGAAGTAGCGVTNPANFAAGSNPNSVTVDPTGKYAYVTNYYSSDISAYKINPDTGALTQVGCVATTATPCGATIASNFATSGSPQSITIDPNSEIVYVSNGNHVSVYTIDNNTGVLTNIGADMPGGHPYAASVDPTSQFVYVANYSDGVSAYTINPLNGALTRIGIADVAAGTNPYSITTTGSIQ